MIEYTYQKVIQFFESIPVEEREDIYAFSFYDFFGDDDIRQPCLDISYNTNSNVVAEGGGNEEKWNYAFWLQDPSVSLGYAYPGCPHPESERVVKDWLVGLGLMYEDGELHDDELDSQIQNVVDKWLVDVVKKLYEDGLVEKFFGKNIPLIIHDLEYSSLDLCKQSIPLGIADEFYSYMDNEGLV